MSGTAAGSGHGALEGERENGLPIGEVAKRTGLSSHALRYYERAGLIAPVHRSGGQRRYATADLDWLAFLLRLRDTGMSIANMQRFSELRRAGDTTTAERLALLEEHRSDVEARIETLRTDLRALDHKIDHYQGLLQEQARAERP